MHKIKINFSKALEIVLLLCVYREENVVIITCFISISNKFKFTVFLFVINLVYYSGFAVSRCFPAVFGSNDRHI